MYLIEYVDFVNTIYEVLFNKIFTFEVQNKVREKLIFI